MRVVAAFSSRLDRSCAGGRARGRDIVAAIGPSVILACVKRDEMLGRGCSRAWDAGTPRKASVRVAVGRRRFGTYSRCGLARADSAQETEVLVEGILARARPAWPSLSNGSGAIELHWRRRAIRPVVETTCLRGVEVARTNVALLTPACAHRRAAARIAARARGHARARCRVEPPTSVLEAPMLPTSFAVGAAVALFASRTG